MASVERETSVTTMEKRQQHSLVIQTVFGASVLTLLLAIWIGLKHWDVAWFVSWGIGLLAFALAGLAVREMLTAKKWLSLSETEQDTVFFKQQRLLGLACISIAVAVLLLLTLLLILVGTLGLPEFISGLMLCGIGIACSILLLRDRKGGDAYTDIAQLLQSYRKFTLISGLIKTAVLVIVGVLLIYYYTLLAIIPAVALILLGICSFAVSTWLFFSAPEDINTNNIRVVMVTAGGMSGIIIALSAFAQLFVWRSDLFAGGLESWHTANAWYYWLTVYLILFGLIVMFLSVYFARIDIRENVTMRRLLYGYNAVFSGILLLATMAILNVVVYASMPYSFNWTRSQGLYALSNRSKAILQSLKEPVHVYVLMSQATGNELASDVRNLLDNCQAYTNKLSVTNVSPETNSNKYRELLERYPKLKESLRPAFHGGASARRGLLIVYGNINSDRPPHTFIPAENMINDPRMNMQRGQEKGAYEFKGEDLLMTELSFLANDQRRPVIYFTQSNGELDINRAETDGMGDSELADKLRAANYEVKQLFWDFPPEGVKEGKTVSYSKANAESKHVVPSDAEALVIARPRSPYTAEVVEAMKAYMLRGGRMVVMLEQLADLRKREIADVGLSDFLKTHGVSVDKGFLLQFRGDMQEPPYIVMATPPAGSNNPIANAFSKYTFPFDKALVVKEATGASGYRAQTILEVPVSQAIVWIETNFNGLVNPYRMAQFRLQNNDAIRNRETEPVSVAVAVSDSEQKPRMVVIGDAQNFSNDPISNAPYQDFFVSSLEWLADRPANIGIEPKKSNMYVIRNTDINLLQMSLVPFGLMFLALVGLGTGVWVVRRR